MALAGFRKATLQERLWVKNAQKSSGVGDHARICWMLCKVDSNCSKGSAGTLALFCVLVSLWSHQKRYIQGPSEHLEHRADARFLTCSGVCLSLRFCAIALLLLTLASQKVTIKPWGSAFEASNFLICIGPLSWTTFELRTWTLLLTVN
jgi:hypothetical protein